MSQDARKIRKAIVLFSGGQDSTLCLALALQQYTCVYTIGFDYGQNHACELEARQNILQALKKSFPSLGGHHAEDYMCPLPELNMLSPTALTRLNWECDKKNLPSTFVPGRNILFFLYAAIWGYNLNAFDIFGGMCEVDYSGYPDCREDTIQSLQKTIKLGFLQPFILHTPLMHITKAQSWHMAHDTFGQEFVDLMLEYTHTCYKNDRRLRHPWGYGCGLCDACQLREKGYNAYINDSSSSLQLSRSDSR